VRFVNRLLDRISPWRRGYSEGFEDATYTAVQDLDDLLRQYGGDPIPCAEVWAIQTRLRAELKCPPLDRRGVRAEP
jgi:hypothetical protein